MRAFLICSAILVLLYFALALNVSLARSRARNGIGLGEPGSPLHRAIRTHGNAAEYTPIFVALFVYFLMSGAGGWIIWVAIAVTLCRVLHALGMWLSSDFNGPPNPLRAIGALGTYLGGFALGIALVMRAML